MPITNEFLNELRTRHQTNETKVLLGDDNTPPAATDIALGNQLLEKTPISKFDGNVGETTNVYLVNAEELVGETIREIGFTTYDKLQSRNLTDEITKSGNEVIQIIHKTTYGGA